MDISIIYSTPLWTSTFPDFDTHRSSFLECAHEFRQANPDGVKKSNFRGYYSPLNLTRQSAMAPFFEYVAQMAHRACFDLDFVDRDVIITEAWVNFNQGRDQFNNEMVQKSTFSGVFFLQSPENSGRLALTNPGLNPCWQGTFLTDRKNQFTADRMKLEPVEGNVLLWPGYLPYSVEPNDHDDTRISVGFNVLCMPRQSGLTPEKSESNSSRG